MPAVPTLTLISVSAIPPESLATTHPLAELLYFNILSFATLVVFTSDKSDIDNLPQSVPVPVDFNTVPLSPPEPPLS